jgi:hypothetical protein
METFDEAVTCLAFQREVGEGEGLVPGLECALVEFLILLACDLRRKANRIREYINQLCVRNEDFEPWKAGASKGASVCFEAAIPARQTLVSKNLSRLNARSNA